MQTWRSATISREPSGLTMDVNISNDQATVPFWMDKTKRSIIYQVFILALVGLLAYYIVSNTISNLERQSIATGFGFLEKESAFEIGESLISYSAAESYGRALIVGFLNTLKVSFMGIIITVIMGTIIGISRLSTNWLVARLAGAYIEVMQNIPVLLQLFFWYSLFYDSFPSPRQSLEPITGVVINNRGIFFAVPEANPAQPIHAYRLFGRLPGGVSAEKMGQEKTGRHRAPLSGFLGFHRHTIGPAPFDLVGLRRAPGNGCPQIIRIQL